MFLLIFLKPRHSAIATRISAALHAMLDGYVARSAAIDPETWARRPATQRFLENLLRLAAPLL